MSFQDFLRRDPNSISLNKLNLILNSARTPRQSKKLLAQSPSDKGLFPSMKKQQTANGPKEIPETDKIKEFATLAERRGSQRLLITQQSSGRVTTSPNDKDYRLVSGLKLLSRKDSRQKGLGKDTSLGYTQVAFTHRSERDFAGMRTMTNGLTSRGVAPKEFNKKAPLTARPKGKPNGKEPLFTTLYENDLAPVTQGFSDKLKDQLWKLNRLISQQKQNTEETPSLDKTFVPPPPPHPSEIPSTYLSRIRSKSFWY